MKKIISLVIAGLLVYEIALAGQAIENNWLAFNIPERWRVSRDSQEGDNYSLELVLQNKKTEGVINLDITPYQGKSLELVRQIRGEIQASKIVTGELEEKEGFYLCHLKKGNMPGMLYVGSDGKNAVMITIFGSRKAIKQAQELLRQIQFKDSLLIFPESQ